jgi:hypothetical protein
MTVLCRALQQRLGHALARACTNKVGLPVVGTTPALTEGTASVDLAGRTKRAAAAKLDALEPRE